MMFLSLGRNSAPRGKPASHNRFSVGELTWMVWLSLISVSVVFRARPISLVAVQVLQSVATYLSNSLK